MSTITNGLWRTLVIRHRYLGIAVGLYRVIANDAESTCYYLDLTTGALLQRADSNRRWHRWLFGAVHRLDFAAWIRVRPIWDIVLIFLMLGGAALSATGVYIALRRIRNDIVLLFRFIGRRRPAPARADPIRI